MTNATANRSSLPMCPPFCGRGQAPARLSQPRSLEGREREVLLRQPCGQRGVANPLSANRKSLNAAERLSMFRTESEERPEYVWSAGQVSSLERWTWLCALHLFLETHFGSTHGCVPSELLCFASAEDPDLLQRKSCSQDKYLSCIAAICLTLEQKARAQLDGCAVTSLERWASCVCCVHWHLLTDLFYPPFFTDQISRFGVAFEGSYSDAAEAFPRPCCALNEYSDTGFTEPCDVESRTAAV